MLSKRETLVAVEYGLTGVHINLQARFDFTWTKYLIAVNSRTFMPNISNEF